VSFDVVANDEDEDFMVLTAAGLPAGATFQVLESYRGYTRGRFTWTPTSTGSFSVTFTAQEKESDEPIPTGLKTSVVVGITVTNPPGPDLTVEKLSWPQTVVIGSPVNLVHTVRNIGTLDAVAPNDGFVTRIYVDGQRLTTTGASRNISNLSAGAGNTSGLQWTPTSCGRTFTVQMKTDDTSLVAELREDNNLTPLHTITVSCTSSPDLVIQTLTVEPSLPASGSIPRFVATVHNSGVAAAGPSQTRLRLDEGSDGTWDLQATASTSALAAGATATHVWFDEWVAKVGKHVVEVCADAAGAVVEGVPGGEDNNCRFISFIVKAGK
jgi:subtilase family serine protease